MFNTGETREGVPRDMKWIRCIVTITSTVLYIVFPIQLKFDVDLPLEIFIQAVDCLNSLSFDTTVIAMVLALYGV